MESPSNASAASRPALGLRLLEIALVFAVFFLQGAWPVPDSNEPAYIGKAIHYWNAEWIPNDFYLNSADSHLVFCVTTGWLSFWLQPTSVAWVVRIVIWGLLAWGWWRLSWALIPRRGYAVLTAALFVCLLERCNMAGEWVVGGAEGKGFAYALLFFGLEALVRERWNRAWIFFGAGAMFHVLVGGWAVVAAGVAWCLAGAARPSLRSMVPGLGVGFLLSLPGLIPSLQLTWGVDPETVRQANWIYVYERLPHHLVFSMFPRRYLAVFGALLLVWWGLNWLTPRSRMKTLLHGFVTGALCIALVGVAINASMAPASAAGLLRLYWFRLSDMGVPLGVALLGPAWVAQVFAQRVWLGRGLLATAVALAGVHLGGLVQDRAVPQIPRTVKPEHYADWRDICDWIAHAPEIPRHARFITPRLNHTFKWYTGRAEVAVHKDLPQDAVSIVEWWDRLNRLYGTGSDDPWKRWQYSLRRRTADELRELGARYQAEFLLTASVSQKLPDPSEPPDPPMELPLVHQCGFWAVYRLSPTAPQTAP